MAIGSGIGAQVGLGEESAYGTLVTPTRFLEFNSESIEVDVGKLESRGIGSGRFLRADRVKTYVKSAKGSLELDVMTKGFGLVFKHMLGSYANTLVAGSERKATVTPDPAALAGKSLTVQVGRPDVGGTVRPFTFKGGKVADWELKCALDDILKLNLNLDFQGVETTTALAAASYPTGAEAFVFTEGALTLGGTTTAVKSVSVKGNNALALERRFLANTKKEPIANGEATVLGDLDCEFEDLAAYTAWVAGTQAELVLTFASPTVIAGGGPYKLVVTLPKVEYRGSTPKVGGPDLVMQPRPFKALYDGTNEIITLAYHSTDAAA